MENTLKFKTNIKCMGCVSQITSALNDAVGVNNWEVDITTADKQLTVKGDNLDVETVVAAVVKAGFRAEVSMN